MARIFITGSADGLGQLAAAALVAQGHHVVLHARNEKRAQQALEKVPGAETVLTADLTDMSATKQLASEVNASGAFDAVIHNAGVYNVAQQQMLSVNVLAPYMLTCLIQKPKRLIYLTSDMHRSGHPKLDCFTSNAGEINYSDSKLHVLMLCKAVARKWADVYANAVNPGWVPTKMGGSHAPDDLKKGYETQAWLAASDDQQAKVSGCYFFHQKQRNYNPIANDIMLQEAFLSRCRKITEIALD